MLPSVPELLRVHKMKEKRPNTPSSVPTISSPSTSKKRVLYTYHLASNID